VKTNFFPLFGRVLDDLRFLHQGEEVRRRRLSRCVVERDRQPGQGSLSSTLLLFSMVRAEDRVQIQARPPDRFTGGTGGNGGAGDQRRVGLPPPFAGFSPQPPLSARKERGPYDDLPLFSVAEANRRASLPFSWKSAPFFSGLEQRCGHRPFYRGDLPLLTWHRRPAPPFFWQSAPSTKVAVRTLLSCVGATAANGPGLSSGNGPTF